MRGYIWTAFKKYLIFSLDSLSRIQTIESGAHRTCVDLEKSAIMLVRSYYGLWHDRPGNRSGTKLNSHITYEGLRQRVAAMAFALLLYLSNKIKIDSYVYRYLIARRMIYFSLSNTTAREMVRRIKKGQEKRISHQTIAQKNYYRVNLIEFNFFCWFRESPFSYQRCRAFIFSEIILCLGSHRIFQYLKINFI